MRKLVVFNSTSLDGFFTDAHNDMSFAHARPDPEWDAFVSGNASGGGTLVFGRITYEMMAGFWPTPFAAEKMPVVAERMNNLPKVVFSRTLDAATWHNTTLVRGDLVESIRTLKEQPGEDMTILGSGSIVDQLAPHGLIDEYIIVIIPVVLGKGRTQFAHLDGRLPLTLKQVRGFTNGNVLLHYESPSDLPAAGVGPRR